MVKHKYAAASVSMYLGGFEVKEIADHLNFSGSHVYMWLQKAGVVLRSTPRWNKYRKVAHTRNQLINELACLKG